MGEERRSGLRRQSRLVVVPTASATATTATVTTATTTATSAVQPAEDRELIEVVDSIRHACAVHTTRVRIRPLARPSLRQRNALLVFVHVRDGEGVCVDLRSLRIHYCGTIQKVGC